MTDQSKVVADVRRGMIPAHLYNDAELFELERERVFGRAWVFVAHESEIPNNGDYVVRRVLEDSFIVARDEQGVVRAHFNMCLHRGMQVCRDHPATYIRQHLGLIGHRARFPSVTLCDCSSV